jgi:hypothetical protein
MGVRVAYLQGLDKATHENFQFLIFDYCPRLPSVTDGSSDCASALTM